MQGTWGPSATLRSFCSGDDIARPQALRAVSMQPADRVCVHTLWLPGMTLS